jgi:hypothetical protein
MPEQFVICKVPFNAALLLLLRSNVLSDVTYVQVRDSVS